MQLDIDYLPCDDKGIMWFSEFDSDTSDSSYAPQRKDPDPMLPQQVSVCNSSQELDFTDEPSLVIDGTEAGYLSLFCIFSLCSRSIVSVVIFAMIFALESDIHVQFYF